MGTKRHNQKLREARAAKMKEARLIEECFSTPAGKSVWAMMMPYYEQKIMPDRTPGMSDFRAGQRDVVGYFYEMRKLTRTKDDGLEIPAPEELEETAIEEVDDADSGTME